MGLDYSFTRFIIKEKIMKIEVPSVPSKISPYFVLFFQVSTAQAEVGKGATIWQADHASLEVDMSLLWQVNNKKNIFLGDFRCGWKTSQLYQVYDKSI